MLLAEIGHVVVVHERERAGFDDNDSKHFASTTLPRFHKWPWRGLARDLFARNFFDDGWPPTHTHCQTISPEGLDHDHDTLACNQCFGCASRRRHGELRRR